MKFFSVIVLIRYTSIRLMESCLTGLEFFSCEHLKLRNARKSFYPLSASCGIDKAFVVLLLYLV